MARKRTEEMTKDCAHAERELNQALFSRDRNLCYKKYEQLGATYESMNRYEDAIKCFENGLEIIKGQLLQEWDMYMNLGDLHAKLNHVEYMSECFGLAFDLVCGTDHMILLVRTFGTFGYALHVCSKSTSKALYCLQEALAIASLINGDKYMKDQIIEHLLFNLGDVYFADEQYDESDKYLTRYVTLHTELDRKEESRKAMLPTGYNRSFLAQNCKLLELDRGPHRNVRLARALGLLGEIRSKKGDHDKAIEYYKKSLSEWAENPLSALNAEKMAYKWIIADMCHRIGRGYSIKYNSTEAEKWLKKALLHAKELNDPELQIEISKYLSRLNFSTGENAKSISVVNSAKDCIDNDGKYQENSKNNVEFLLMESRRQIDSKLLSEAHLTARLALGKCKGDDRKRVECFLQLADISLRRESYDDVNNYLEKAWPICEREEPCNMKLDALYIYTRMHISLRQYDLARIKASEYLKIALTTEFDFLKLEGYHCLGKIARYQGDLAVAENCYHEMLKLNSGIKQPDTDFQVRELHYLIEIAKPETTAATRIKLLFQLREVALKTGDTEAINYCISHVNSLSQKVDDPKDKMLLSSTYKIFLKAGLAHNEKISRSYGEHDEHKVSSLKDFTEIHKKLVQYLTDNDETDEALVFADRGRMSILQEILRKKYCMAVADESESEGLNLGTIRDMATRENCCIVFYLMQENCMMIWVISEKGIECQKITKFMCEDRELIFAGETDPAYYLRQIVCNLDAVVGQGYCFRGKTWKDFADGDSTECGDEDLMIPKEIFCEFRGDTAGDNDNELSTKLMNSNQFELLHDWLIAPIEDKLTKDKIIIIPDNFMFQIPFNALKNRNTGKHLADTRNVRLAPSLMTLQLLTDPSSLHEHSQEGALIVAADDVGKVKYDGKEETFPKLKYAAEEAEMIGKLLEADPLIGKEATRHVVVNQLSGDHKVLHIAAHGISPGKIILTPNDTSTGCLPRKEDYMLHMSDVMKIGVRAQLVVLSCCKSGDGPQTPEGIIGFGRAFLAAGARAVIVALWNVKDKATFLLMEKFYQCFVDGKSASSSLNEAVKALKSIELYKHEKIWAPFVLLGDDVYWNEKAKPVATVMLGGVQEEQAIE